MKKSGWSARWLGVHIHLHVTHKRTRETESGSVDDNGDIPRDLGALQCKFEPEHRRHAQG